MQKRNQDISQTESRISPPPFGEVNRLAKEEWFMSLLSLSHTKMEHQLYKLMLSETRNLLSKVGVFSIRHLMTRSGLNTYSSVRRARTGLIRKMSIEQHELAGDAQNSSLVYVIYSPAEIFERRLQAGLPPHPPSTMVDDESNLNSSSEVVGNLIQKHNITRREAQVALRCAEGLTNAEIGKKLFIQEETVKFHLRNIFIKFGVKRRTELMARLFRQN